MEIIGYVASILIGLSLGLIGGGGSILTVPVLVYLFGKTPIEATSYSLFIVGCTSLVGAWRQYVKNHVDLRTVVLFGFTSVTTVFLTRKFVIPALPETLATIGSFELKTSMVIMVLFAVLMLLASTSMIKGRKEANEANEQKGKSFGILMVYGLGIGLVTGFLGAGGGFLLIPALVFFVGLEMKTAIGTSLAIIAVNSLIGFTGDIGNREIDWVFLLIVTGIAIVGIITGIQLGKKIPGAKLRKGFGWFVLIMGLYIIIDELFIP